MTERELREIKRRFRPEKSNIPRIVGCFVNGNGQIIANISQTIEFSDSVVSEKLLGIMKKTLAGTMGTTLFQIDFSTNQVTDSEEHKLLMSLRDTALKDNEVLSNFFKKVIASVKFDGNYVILLANDIYDVFEHGNDGEESFSSERFSYIVCAICEVKNMSEALSFSESDSLFHISGASSMLSAPELGFMFPSFDDRKANIYSVLYHNKNIADTHAGFVEAIFGSKPIMPPKLQGATFNLCLKDALEEECDFELVRSVHSQISELAESHKESRDPDPLVITKATVKSVLASSGVAEEKIEKMEAALDESFGTGAVLYPKNIINTKKFDLVTPDVTIKVNPEKRDLIETQMINGVQYIMIKATSGVEVNGINIASDNLNRFRLLDANIED